MSDFEDTRVDVCLYFIAPHNLRPVDIVMVDQIGKLVPVIPVIAKVTSRLAPTSHPMQAKYHKII